MNIEQAIKNIDTVIQNTRMTRQEHVELDSNLKLLVARAQASDKLQERIDVLEDEITKLSKTKKEVEK